MLFPSLKPLSSPLPTPARGTCPPRAHLPLACGCHVVARRDSDGAIRVGRVDRVVPCRLVQHLAGAVLAALGAP